VAEFHRLPEHPVDYRGEVCCPLKKQPDGMELISTLSTFINGAEDEVKAHGGSWRKGYSVWSGPVQRTRDAGDAEKKW
jgi:hypothetical protein